MIRRRHGRAGGRWADFDHEPATLSGGSDGLFAQMLAPVPPAPGPEGARL